MKYAGYFRKIMIRTYQIKNCIRFILMRFVLRIQDIILVKAAHGCKFCSLSGNARGNGNRDMTV